MLRAAAAHRGSSLVEIYQNCNIFNDGAFEMLKGPDTREEFLIRLEHGQPVRFGADLQHGVVRAPDGGLRVAEVDEVGVDSVLVHDTQALDPSTAFALSRLADPGSLVRTPIGVFRAVQRPTYDDLMNDQIIRTVETQGDGDLAALLQGKDSWTVS